MNSTERAPLPDERVLEMAGIKLAEVTGKERRAEPGPLLKRPGTPGVRLGPRHSDSYRHIDLEFLLSVDRAAESSLPDCAAGLAADPEEATGQAIADWADTTASVALELLEQRGSYATHFGPATPGCFPGWHAIVGGVSGWGVGENSAPKGLRVSDTWHPRPSGAGGGRTLATSSSALNSGVNERRLRLTPPPYQMDMELLIDALQIAARSQQRAERDKALAARQKSAACVGCHGDGTGVLPRGRVD